MNVKLELRSVLRRTHALSSRAFSTGGIVSFYPWRLHITRQMCENTSLMTGDVLLVKSGSSSYCDEWIPSHIPEEVCL